MDAIERAEAIRREYERWRAEDDTAFPLEAKESPGWASELEEQIANEDSEEIRNVQSALDNALALEADQEESANLAREERWAAHRVEFVMGLG